MLDDFRNMITYKNLTDWMPEYYKEWEVERFFMETQGNYTALHDSLIKYQNSYMGHRSRLNY